MLFLNRERELAALSELGDAGGLAVVWGRRRIGKTRLLVEWCERERGTYTVADQSAPETQRAYFARAIRQLPGVLAGREVVRALFVPAMAPRTPRVLGGVHIVRLRDIQS